MKTWKTKEVYETLSAIAHNYNQSFAVEYSEVYDQRCIRIGGIVLLELGCSDDDGNTTAFSIHPPMVEEYDPILSEVDCVLDYLQNIEATYHTAVEVKDICLEIFDNFGDKLHFKLKNPNRFMSKMLNLYKKDSK